MNKIILTGRLTKDPDLRATTSGISVNNFTLAVQRDFKNDKGEYDVDFINCVAYRNTAELIDKYVKKGHKIAVEGRLQVRTYDDKDGKKIYVSEVIINNIEFLESRKENTAENTAGEQGSAEKESDPFENFGNNITVDQIDDSMLPF